MQVHKQWHYWAESDLMLAKGGLTLGDVSIGPILYLSHDCVEKALKAYLAYKQYPIAKTNDLMVLTNLCATFDQDFSQLTTDAVALTPYAQARYPNKNFIMPDVSGAELAIKKAGTFSNW